MQEAWALLAERGLADLSLSELGRRLDTSAGHLSYYFGSKSGLLLELFRWSEDELAEQREVVLQSDDSAEERLHRLCTLNFPRAAGDPRWLLWVELWPRVMHEPALREAQLEYRRGVARRDRPGARRADSGRRPARATSDRPGGRLERRPTDGRPHAHPRSGMGAREGSAARSHDLGVLQELPGNPPTPGAGPRLAVEGPASFVGCVCGYQVSADCSDQGRALHWEVSGMYIGIGLGTLIVIIIILALVL